MKNETKIWTQYAMDVVSGKIVTCHLIKRACERYLKDINSDKYELRDDIVERCVNFIQMFKHFKGSASGTHFKLENWQAWILANLYGIYYKGTNKRKYNEAYIEVARKNAKTFLTAAMAMYSLVADGVDGAEILLLATSREQAKISFEDMEVFSKQIDPKHNILKIYRDRIKMPINNSMALVCSSDDSKLDGRFGSFCCCDEYHAHKTSALRSVIKSGMTRPNALLVTITTAGFSLLSPCYKLRTSCTEILEGVKEDDATFAAIYSLDEEDLLNDNWQNPDVWVKSNPNIGKSVEVDYIKRQITTAINNTSEEVAVKTKTLNIWCSSSETWISDSYILPCMKKISFEEFKDCETYIGVDLSSVSDMTAISYLMKKEDDDNFYFKTDYYLPESCLIESPNRELYKYWVQTNQLHLTPGNTVDYDYIINDIMKNYNLLNIRKISYDSYNSTSWAIKCTELGLPLEPYSQSIANFNKPTKDFEILIRTKKAVIDSNEITMWMFRNVEIKSDWNNNTKPVKVHKEKKIDGIVSMIESLGSWQTTSHYSGGLFVL